MLDTLLKREKSALVNVADCLCTLSDPVYNLSGVTVIYVSPGNVFPAHISLGICVSPHTYH